MIETRKTSFFIAFSFFIIEYCVVHTAEIRKGV
jgi:hypothetical protein